jgi:NTE family protein
VVAVGLVLGAGGAVGAAYHAGALAALEEGAAWDPRTATVVVGTSAGAGLAASLRAGLSAADHLARATDTPLSDAGARLLAHLPAPVDLPSRPLAPIGVPRPASPGMVLATALRREVPRPGLAVAAVLPRGGIATTPIGDAVRGLSPRPWPDEPTWICAVRLGDGRRVVFGRDDPGDDGAEPDLGTAVEASSAVPGFFSPVRVGRHDFIDGAVHSSTNADLLAGIRLDAVVVVAPMAAVPRALGRSVNTVTRLLHASLLRREVAALRRERVPVLVLQPTTDDLRVMGLNAMDRSRRGAVAARARRSVLGKLERPEVGPFLECFGGVLADR